MRISEPLLIAAIALATMASPLYAQTQRLRISSAVSGAVGDGGPAAAVTVAGAIDVAPRAGVEIELLYIPRQEFRDERSALPLSFPAPPSLERTTAGRTLGVLSSLVGGFEVGRMRPYAQIGGGLANVQYRIRSATSGPVASGPVVSTAPIATSTTTVNSNSLVLAAGGGVDVRVWKSLAVGVDVRYHHLFASTADFEQIDQITRVGLRIGYRF